MITQINKISERILAPNKLQDFVAMPKVVYVNKFTEESLKQFKQDFNDAKFTKQEVIPIFIDSYGGAVDALTGMIDEIKNCDVPVATIATGKAMSCGAFLLAAGTKGYRYISPNARVLIHQISSWTIGKKEDIQADANEMERLSQLMWGFMNDWCQKPQGYFEQQMKDRLNADWYLNPTEAFKYGLVDYIGIPKLKTTIEVKSELKL